MYAPIPSLPSLRILDPNAPNCNEANGLRSFEIPGWGGVVIAKNVNSSTTAITKSTYADFLGYVVSHIRQMFGVANVDDKQYIHSSDGISQWEMDVLSRNFIYR